MKASIQKWLENARRRMERRLRPKRWSQRAKPMLAARNIHYETAERISALAAGGIGAMHLLAQQSGLVELIDRHLHLLKRHLPYHESDHVLNLAYNILAGGSRIEHLELRRNDEVYLNALGAERIPDPTTAGDFCRRFTATDVEGLLECINEARLRVWKRQPKSFFAEAVIDGDGTIAPTDGECKQGMDLAYNGQWGYTPAACAKSYRLIVLRKTIIVTCGQRRLFDEVVYFFYLSNEWDKSEAWTVADANGRCNQENLIAQLKGGVKALALPVDSLVSNWAYMVMASLAWTLKVWAALWLPESGRWAEQHTAEKQRLLRMEFPTFVQAMIQIPCQIVKTGRRVAYRLLSWNPWVRVLLRLVGQLRQPLRC